MFNAIISSKFRTILLFIFLGFLCYGWGLDSPFKLMDDYACIVENQAIRVPSEWTRFFTDSFFGGDGAYYRPLVSLSFMLEYQAFRLQHIFYNLNNILLHISTALLVWAVLIRLLKDRTWAFYASLLFLIHPVHWEQITNIPGRSILLCAFFVMAALYCLLKNLETRGPAAVVHYVISLTAFAAGLLSKESAATFPLIVIGLMMFCIKTDIRRKIILTLPYFILLAAYVWLRSHLGITKLMAVASPADVAPAVMTFLKSVGIHLTGIFLPSNLIYDRSLEVFKSFSDIGLWITAGAGAIVIAALIYDRRSISGLQWFWLSWIVLSFFPVSQLVPIYVSDGRISIADHFLYLPSIGIFVLLVQSVRNFSRRPSMQTLLSGEVRNILVLLWLGYLTAMTVIQVLISTDQFAMFESALDDNPRNNRVRTALASAYGYAGMPEKAEKHFRNVLAYSPWEVKARIGLGKALCDQNRCLEALVEYQNVFNPGPKDAQLLKNNLEKTYPIVIREYEAKVAREPQNAEFHRILGTLYADAGRTSDGEAHLHTASELEDSPIEP